jgi:anti-sigma B factor antagonist
MFADEVPAREDLVEREDRAGPERFRVEVRSGRADGIVTPVGELDLATAETLERVVGDVADAGAALLVLDLRRLSFMDCSGLHVLLRSQSRARRADARLVIACGPGQVRRLLTMTGADQGLEIVENLKSVRPIGGARV